MNKRIFPKPSIDITRKKIFDVAAAMSIESSTRHAIHRLDNPIAQQVRSPSDLSAHPFSDCDVLICLFDTRHLRGLPSQPKNSPAKTSGVSATRYGVDIGKFLPLAHGERYRLKRRIKETIGPKWLTKADEPGQFFLSNRVSGSGNRVVNILDSFQDWCYPKNSQKATSYPISKVCGPE
jgi:hypothetical protein